MSYSVHTIVIIDTWIPVNERPDFCSIDTITTTDWCKTTNHNKWATARCNWTCRLIGWVTQSTNGTNNDTVYLCSVQAEFVDHSIIQLRNRPPNTMAALHKYIIDGATTHMHKIVQILQNNYWCQGECK